MAQTLLGFDFGAQRIGVAVGNTITGSAEPLAVIAAEPLAVRWRAIADLVGQWQPQRLVVGRPRQHGPADRTGTAPPELDTAPTEPAIAARCERFARQLAGRFGLPVELVDEGYSSLEAAAAMAAQAHRRGHRDEPDDAEAAAIILRQYLSAGVNPARTDSIR